MKFDLIADTNFLIYVHEGNQITEPFLQFNYGISFITEVELLSFNGISKLEEEKLKELLNDCFLIEWNTKIKEQTIAFRRMYSLKLPDAIIAASAFVYGVPLVTADKAFSKIDKLDLILIEF